MENENKDALVFIIGIMSGFFALVASFCFMLMFLGSRDYASLEGVLNLGVAIIVCASIFVICLATDIADSNGKIKALKREKETLIENRENTGHALAALQNCILGGNKNVTAFEMRMKVNTIVNGLDLPVGFDTEKLKEWEDKILSTAL